MSPDERERLLEKVLDALSDPRAAMSEGRPHKKAKTRSLDMLGLHFGATGRIIYLAEEMAVLYPGEEVFTRGGEAERGRPPDGAVRGFEQPPVA